MTATLGGDGPAAERAATLCDAARAGDRRALARLLTAVENHTPVAEAALRRLYPLAGAAHLVGITGPPGAGKSTLVAALIAELRRAGRSVAVVAVDPSSPITGGALLGDRVRMQAYASDDGVFIRSMASRGHAGGLASTSAAAAAVLDAAGFDVVLLETVGTGQSEVEVAAAADTTVVLEAPEMGDEVQAIKAGLLEVADIVVVNKGDRPGAQRTAAQLRAMLVPTVGRGDADPSRPAPKRPEVIVTTALTGDGIPELVALLDRRRADGSAAQAARVTRAAAQVDAILAQRIRDRLADGVEAGVTGRRVRGGRPPRAGSLRGRGPPARAARRGGRRARRAAVHARDGGGVGSAAMAIERVFVAGAGLMGHGIAQVHAAAGKQVTLYEPDLARAAAGRDRIAGNLDRAVAKSKLHGPERDAILARIAATDALDAAAGADLVVEAVFEDVDVKTRLWADLDRVAPPGALFGTNTSSISIDRLAGGGGGGEAPAVRRRPLLQPRARDAADRADPRLRHRRRDRGRRPRARRRARQAGHRLGGPARVHREPDPDAAPRRGDADVRGGHRDRRRHRRRRPDRAQPSDGPARARRLHRARRGARDHAGPARGVRPAPVRAAGRPRAARREGHLGQKTGRGFHTYPR